MFKLIGAILGLIIWGFWGFILGIILGHQIDKLTPYLLPKLLKNILLKHHAKIHQTFFEATFSIMGCIAKADGHVSEKEIAMARKVIQHMKLDKTAEQQAINYFNQGKQPDFNIDAMLTKLRSAALRHKDLIRMFIEIQLSAGYADGELHPAERELLLKICTHLGLSEADFERLDSMIKAQIHNRQPGRTSGMSMEDAYAILDIDASISDAEVKKSYRRLTNQHHPDKLAAKGLPPEMMKIAGEKTHEIRIAYERIKEERGFR